jgi:hypothetical protein
VARTFRLRRALGAALACGLLVVAGCGEADTRFSYPEESQEVFLSSCEASSGGDSGYCECLLDEFQNTLPFEEFTRIDREILQRGVQGLAPEDRELFLGAVETCGGEVGADRRGALSLAYSTGTASSERQR